LGDGLEQIACEEDGSGEGGGVDVIEPGGMLVDNEEPDITELEE
jgi:hypothetical protein